MLNYTKGSQKDGKFNHFIYLEKVRKEIYQTIKDTIPHHEMFLNNYNIYKSFLLQKLVHPIFNKNKTAESEKKMKLTIDIIADKEFYDSLKERIENFINSNNDQNEENSSVNKGNIATENSIMLPETQRILRMGSPKLKANQYSHIKSKVKASITPLQTLGAKKERKGVITQVNMELLTYLKDNTVNKRKNSFSTDESESPKGKRRFKNIVLNIQPELEKIKIESRPQLELLQPGSTLPIEGRNDILSPISGVNLNDLRVMSADGRCDGSNSQSCQDKSDSSSCNMSARSKNSNSRGITNQSRLRTIEDKKTKLLSQNIKQKTFIINNSDKAQPLGKREVSICNIDNTKFSPINIPRKLNRDTIKTIISRRNTKLSSIRDKKSINPVSPKTINRFVSISPQIRYPNMPSKKSSSKLQPKLSILGTRTKFFN